MDKLHGLITEYLYKYIRNIPDFPKPGIQFKDITPLLKEPEALQLTTRLLARPFNKMDVDYVLGIESRGFIFGTLLAQELNAGFIPVRKPGKLPGDTVDESYKLEYGEATVEMHKDALEPGKKVLVHDDLIATGGSAAAATRLINYAGADLVGYSFIIELGELEGHKALDQNVPYEVLMAL